MSAEIILTALMIAPLLAWLFYLSVHRRESRYTPSIDDIAFHLGQMGYRLTPYGKVVALLSLKSGYNAVEIASHLAHVTLAGEVRAAGADRKRLGALAEHGRALLKLLEQHEQRGHMHPAQWQQDSRAILGVITPNEENKAWLEKVLSDPIVGREPVAVRSHSAPTGVGNDICERSADVVP